MERVAGILGTGDISNFFGNDKIYQTESDNALQEFKKLNSEFEELNQQIKNLDEQIVKLKEPFMNEEGISSEWKNDVAIQPLRQQFNGLLKQRLEIQRKDFFTQYKDTLDKMNKYNISVECDFSDLEVLKGLRKDTIERPLGCEGCNGEPDFEIEFRQFAKEKYDKLITAFGAQNLYEDPIEIPQESLNKLKEEAEKISVEDRVKLSLLGMQNMLLPLEIPSNMVKNQLVVTDADRRVTKYEYQQLENQVAGIVGEVNMVMEYPIVDKNRENRYYYVQRATKYTVSVAKDDIVKNGQVSLKLVELKVRPAKSVITKFV